MATRNFQIRLDDVVIAEIEKRAKDNRLTSSAMARVFIRDGLAGFDRKHEVLVDKIDVIQKAIEQSNLLTAMAMAAVSFLDVGRIDGKTESGKDRVRANIESATKMGRVIKKMGDDGLLNKDL